MSETHYLTVPLLREAPLKDVLDALLDSKMTDSWKQGYAEFYYGEFKPLPCLRADMEWQRYTPGSFATTPRTLREAIIMCEDFILQGQITMIAFQEYRTDRVDHHFGPFPDSSTCMVDTRKFFEQFLPCAITDEARSANQIQLDNHDVECIKAMRRRYEDCANGCEIIRQLNERFTDIECWARRSLDRGHQDVMPPRMAMVFVEVAVWHYKTRGAIRYFGLDWDEAQARHARWASQTARAEQEVESEAETEQGSRRSPSRSPRRHTLE